MTLNEYAARVTALVDEQTDGTFVYPKSFESDVEVCFTNRLTPEQAAEEILQDAQ